MPAAPAPRTARLPRLYGDLSGWFHLVTHPKEYVREAALIRRLLKPKGTRGRPSLLELGAGGGNNAFHLKKHFDLTLTDLSPAMLRQSRRINPECRHLPGDMRTLRRAERFDAVLVHDAVMYLTTRRDLARAIRTAAAHLKPGGRALLMPDFLSETFAPRTTTGGHGENGRALRYVEVTRTLRPGARKAVVDMTMLLHDGKRSDRIVVDRHVFGLFPRRVWTELLAAAGLAVTVETDPWGREIFLGQKAD